MALLREHLVSAQQEKANRLEYDAIANDILSTKVMRLGREEQKVNMQRLEAEIVELEEERRQYGEVWQARREQFGEIVGRLEKMQEQIQEDKEEHGKFKPWHRCGWEAPFGWRVLIMSVGRPEGGYGRRRR